jgi:hypothetical protein
MNDMRKSRWPLVLTDSQVIEQPEMKEKWILGTDGGRYNRSNLRIVMSGLPYCGSLPAAYQKMAGSRVSGG